MAKQTDQKKIIKAIIKQNPKITSGNAAKAYKILKEELGNG
jgi:hypothetical protein